MANALGARPPQRTRCANGSGGVEKNSKLLLHSEIQKRLATVHSHANCFEIASQIKRLQ
jgi:hypothetical protein